MLLSVIMITCTLLCFYFFYQSISGTPSEDALWSVIVLVLVYQLLNYLPIEWPISDELKVWLHPAFFILLAIIFGEDLKKMLSKWGRKLKIKQFLRRNQLSQAAIDELVSGIHLLSKDSIGALIVIQQRADLTSIIRGGIELDSRIESGLLYSIFISNRHNHLHDGAVLIQEDRLTHAAVYLPMTRSMNLEKHLGTRHRAALGTAEETDAIVIAVSEERGTISMAYAGKLFEDIDIRTLKQKLQGLLYKSSLDRLTLY